MVSSVSTNTASSTACDNEHKVLCAAKFLFARRAVFKVEEHVAVTRMIFFHSISIFFVNKKSV